MKLGSTGPVRVLRTATLVTASVVLGAVVHERAGGPPPTSATLLVLALVLAIPVARLSRGRVSGPVALGVLLAGQLGLHLAGAMATSAQGPALSAADLQHAGHAGHAATTHVVPVEHLAHLGTDPRMLAGHVLVASLLALLWSRGEDALFALVERLSLPRAPGLTLPTAPLALPAPLPAYADEVLRRVRARGPPLS